MIDAKSAANRVNKTLDELANLRGRHRENLILAQHGSRRVANLKKAHQYAGKMAALYAEQAKIYEQASANSSEQSTRARVISGAHGAVACGKLAEVLLVCSKFTGAMKTAEKTRKAWIDSLDAVKTGVDAAKDVSEVIQSAQKKGSGVETGVKAGTTFAKFFELGRDLADIVDAIMAWMGMIPPPKGKKEVSGAELIAAFGKTLKALFLVIKSVEFRNAMVKSGQTLKEFNESAAGTTFSQGADAMGAIANIAEAIIACYNAYNEFKLAEAFADASQSELGFSSRMWGGSLNQVEVSVLQACLANKEQEIKFEYFQRLTRNRGASRELLWRLDRELKVLVPRLKMANSEQPLYAARLSSTISRLAAEVDALNKALYSMQNAWMVSDPSVRSDISSARPELEKTLMRGYAALQ